MFGIPLTLRTALGAVTLAGCIVGTNGALAESHSPSLVTQWLNGETPYDGPEITYDGPPVTVRFSTFVAPSGTTADTNWVKAFDRLAKDTNGKLIIKPFWSSSLADAQRGAFEAVSTGVAQMSSCYAIMSPAGLDLQMGLQMPFFVTRSTASAMAIQEIYAKYLRDSYEAKGVYLARAGTTPPNQLLTTGDPIRTLEDMKGKKVWGIGSVPTAVLQALGSVPVPLSPADLYQSMQSGVTDVTPMHDAGAKFFRLDELAKTHTAANLTGSPVEYCINKAFFDGLPSDLKGAFYLWLQKWNFVDMELYFDGDAAATREQMAANGVEMIELPQEEMQRWKEATQPVVEAWIAENEAKGLPARQFIEDYLALTAKYEAMSDNELFQQIVDTPFPDLISSYEMAE